MQYKKQDPGNYVPCSCFCELYIVVQGLQLMASVLGKYL